MRIIKLAVLFSAAFLISLALAGAESYGAGARSAASGPSRLGMVQFRVSCSTPARESFDTAVALLHSFQYEEAEKAFGGITRKDPHCAMAYWGLAMSLDEQLWDFPAPATLEKGHRDVEKAQELGGKTDRERQYIAAAAAFYQTNPQLSHVARYEAYSRAMAQLYARHPEDVNAGAFYALSLVALAQEGVDNLSNRKHAIAILDKLFAAHPDNPGVDHYLIHASDDPRLAAFGLAAARNYARLAPDSAHALHMPSHIFTRLGYWQDSIQSNLASAAAAREATASGRDDESTYQTHALTFLEYAYLQCGMDAQARHVIQEVMTVPGDNAHDLAEMQQLFEVTYDVETHDWNAAAALAVPAGDVFARDAEAIDWARTIGAARAGDVAGARQDFQRLQRVDGTMALEEKKRHLGADSGRIVAQMQAHAWLDFAEGRHDQAVQMMRAAAAKEGPYGVDVLGMPAEEMLGDLLMELREAQQALDAYQAGLKESPNRLDGLYGAARAAGLAGDKAAAKSYFAKLATSCSPAADRKPCREARVFLARSY